MTAKVLVTVVFERAPASPLPRVQVIQGKEMNDLVFDVQEFLRDCAEVFTIKSHTVTVLP